MENKQLSLAEQIEREKKSTTLKLIDAAKTSYVTVYKGKAEEIFEREKQYALMAIQKNPKIMSCEPTSIRMAVAQVAMAGLTLDPTKRMCYLIPRDNKCTLVIDYKGVLDIMFKEVGILYSSGIVYEGDEGAMDFKEGAGGYVNAKRRFNRPDNAPKLYVYGNAVFPDNRNHVFIMEWKDVLKRKKRASTDKVWNEWEEEMTIKTCIHAHSKYLPKTEKMENIFAAMTEEIGANAPMKNTSEDDLSILPDGIIESAPEPVKPKEPTKAEKKPEKKVDAEEAQIISETPTGDLDPNKV